VNESNVHWDCDIHSLAQRTSNTDQLYGYYKRLCDCDWQVASLVRVVTDRLELIAARRMPLC